MENIVKILDEEFAVTVRELNEFANPHFANNGGGYSQPEFTVTSGKRPNWVLTIRDTSCGNFGSRYSAVLTLCGEVIASAYWGSMENGDGIDTQFTGLHTAWCAIARRLGYEIPTTKSWEYISQEYNRYTR